MFNVFCLSQLPDLAGVAKAAGFGEFAQIAGKELDGYRPKASGRGLSRLALPRSGRRVRAHRHEVEARRRPQEAASQARQGGDEVACSLLFPAAEAKAPVLAGLSKMLGRAPDETREEGPARLYVWNGKGDKALSHVDYSVPLKPGPKGVLSASVFVLN